MISMQIRAFCLYLLYAWIISEVLFYFIVKILIYPSLKSPRTPQKGNRGISLAKRIIKTAGSLQSYSVQKFVEGFFLKSKLQDIKLDNLKSFMAWVMYASPLSYMKDTNLKEIDEAIDLICAEMKCAVPSPGFNTQINHVNMTYDTFSFVHRPFLLYIISGAFNLFSNYVLSGMGFQKFSVGSPSSGGVVNYWYRTGSQFNNMHPMVFFHGITAGWGIYSTFILRLAEDRPVVLMEMECIKVNSLVFHMAAPEVFSASVKDILIKHGHSKASVVGHSFGSITAGWFIKAYPEMVSHAAFLDPVSLLLSLPDVAYNFLYRYPTTLVEWYIYYGASMEITISYALRRNFWWYNNVFWLEELDPSIPFLVVLGGNDEVGNPVAIQEYVNKCASLRTENNANKPNISKISSIFVNGYSHAQMIACGQTQKQILGMIRQQENSIKK